MYKRQGGKYRLIDIPISNCLHSGIKDIYVITQFNSESLNNHINNTYRFDYFSRAFVRILAAEQTLENANWFQGTADAVRKSLSHLDLFNIENVLILSGDHLYTMDYRDLVDFHNQHNADFTVSVVPVKEDETREFGMLKMQKGGRITGFKEKPIDRTDLKPFRFPGKARGSTPPLPHPTYLASMGVYLFRVDVLKEVLESKDVDFGREVIPNSIKKWKGLGYIFNDYWKDIGTIKSFYDVNIDFTANKPHFSFFGKAGVFTRPRFLPPAHLSGNKITDCLLTEGCIVREGAELDHSIIGLRSVIGSGCRISKTVLMGADYYEKPYSSDPVRVGIGAGTVIEHAIIDKNARIGKNVVIKNLHNLKKADGRNYYIRDSIVIIPKNAVIRDNTKI